MANRNIAPFYQSAQRSIQMLFSSGKTCKNAEYSWQDQTHMQQRPLVHEWQIEIVSRSKWACQQNCQYHSVNIQPVLRYWQGLSLLSPLLWAQAPSKRPKTQKKCVVSNILALKTAVFCMVTRWAVMCHHTCMLCPVSHYFFGENIVLKHQLPSATSTLFSYISYISRDPYHFNKI